MVLAQAQTAEATAAYSQTVKQAFRSLVEARQAELSAFVEVYRALGGGWRREGGPTS